MESMKCQMEAGPMPPKVVMTHGRKRRPLFRIRQNSNAARQSVA